MPHRRAFTLVELLVVVAIIVALLAILLPSMSRAIEVTHRAVCGSNQRQIGAASLSYTVDNMGALLYCGNRRVQIAFFNNSPRLAGDANTDVFGEWSRLGLMRRTENGLAEPGEVWDCPARDFRSWSEDPLYKQVVIGYQYYGGVFQWDNAFAGPMPSRSPVRLSTSGSGWVLAADTSGKIDGSWGAGRDTAYGGMPSHRSSLGPWPEGQNQLYTDGSVGWVEPEDMVYVHSWGGAGSYSRVMFIAQKDLGGWVPSVGAYLEAFK